MASYFLFTVDDRIAEAAKVLILNYLLTIQNDWCELEQVLPQAMTDWVIYSQNSTAHLQDKEGHLVEKCIRGGETPAHGVTLLQQENRHSHSLLVRVYNHPLERLWGFSPECIKVIRNVQGPMNQRPSQRNLKRNSLTNISWWQLLQTHTAHQAEFCRL